MRPITFAHRGARLEAPENTIPAFRRALEQGASGLESDAWLSTDGHPVLVHDAVVRRGLRRIKVAGSTAARLGELGVPTLGELYAACGAAFELSLDLKDPAAGRPVVDTAARHGALDRLWLCAGRLRLLADLAAEPSRPRLVHSTRRERLPEPVERHTAALADAGVDALSLRWTDWTAGLVTLVHRFGLRAFAWDTQETRHLRAALGMGVDAVYSDNVVRMVAVVAEWSEPSGD